MIQQTKENKQSMQCKHENEDKTGIPQQNISNQHLTSQNKQNETKQSINKKVKQNKKNISHNQT